MNRRTRTGIFLITLLSTLAAASVPAQQVVVSQAGADASPQPLQYMHGRLSYRKKLRMVVLNAAAKTGH